MNKVFIYRIMTLGLTVMLLLACDRYEPQYPDVPEIDYESFSLYYEIDTLGQRKLSGDLLFSFTDGDGNIGLKPVLDTLGLSMPDTLLYNLFLQLYDYKDDRFVEVPEEEGGKYKYRIPYLDKQPLIGTISVKIDYPIILHDTIFYTFYLYDRDFNKSNVDSTEVIIFTGLNSGVEE